jgi:hypothetical protein
VVSSKQQESNSGTLAKEAKAVISRLKSDIDLTGVEWKLTVLETIAKWPLAQEEVEGEQLDYLIGGEAFD